MAIAEANDEWTEIARGFRHSGEFSRLKHLLECVLTYYCESSTFLEKAGWHDEITQVKYELALV